ncbi:alpha/beta fold hydrolase [Ramlibacter sp.]|uniref:alpha/beta hydrolase family protein n=1 Tax=Ramlibacter sp. TaxID=1917967 RepID=UPI002B7C4446|nr:alpha/beta fold hydrolase [Ramlibacter sp.]HWI84165.1 alpha/beta fold hydrolase [Ramlibacter sp.]
MRPEVVQVADGTRLAACVWDAAGPPRGSVVVGGAMGVPQDFYAPFARWLAQRGWRVTTFDYRGSGQSRPASGSLRGFHADLFDWTRDYAAVIDHAQAALPHRSLYLLGHSLGAQLPGLLANQHKVDGLLSVAAGSGYWRQNAPALRRVVLIFWFLLVPIATRLCGYFPGRRLRVVGDLPAGVVLQWRRWCLNPRYSVGAEGEAVRRRYASARFPVRALSIEDDELMTDPGIRSLLALYENAPSEIERIVPRQFGIARLGHFGAFRREREADFWPLLAQWLGRFEQAQAR